MAILPIIQGILKMNNLTTVTTVTTLLNLPTTSEGLKSGLWTTKGANLAYTYEQKEGSWYINNELYCTNEQAIAMSLQDVFSGAITLENKLTFTQAGYIISSQAGKTLKEVKPVQGSVLTAIQYKAAKIKLLDDDQLASLYDACIVSTAKLIVQAFEPISLEDREAVKNLELKEAHERIKFDNLIGYKDIKTLQDGSYSVTLSMPNIGLVSLIPANNFELLTTTPVNNGFLITFKDVIVTI